MDESAIAFGHVICSLRQKTAISQEVLAERAGIHRTYVSQLERGLKSPTLSILLKLAKALEVRPSRIIQLLEKRLDEVPSS